MAQCNHDQSVPVRGRQKRLSQIKGIRTEAEVRKEQGCYAASFEDGGRGP